MRSRFDDHQPTALEEQAHAEARRHFAEHLKQFPATREAVERLERDMAKIALAANMAASQPAGNVIQADDGEQWHNGVALMENIYLCHRPVTGGVEFAVVEHFPARGRNEIWNRGRNAVEVLRTFAREQRQALQAWTEDMTAQVKEFLTEKYPGQDMNRVADSFMHRFTHAVSVQSIQFHEPNHSRGVRI
jgi:hypothetical protein